RHRADSDGARERAQRFVHIVGRAKFSIWTGIDDVVWVTTSVGNRADEPVGTWYQQWLGRYQEKPGGGSWRVIGKLCERRVIRIFCRVDRFGGFFGFLLRDEIVFRALHVGQRVREHRGQAQNAHTQNDQ